LLLTTFNYRVHHPDVAKVVAAKYPKVRLIDPVKVLGSWDQIQATQFANGGILDQLLAQRR
jgi:sulfate transport system substrate-binding protein